MIKNKKSCSLHTHTHAHKLVYTLRLYLCIYVQIRTMYTTHTHTHIQDIDIHKDPVRWIRGRLIYIAFVGSEFRIGRSVRRQAAQRQTLAVCSTIID